MLLYASQMKGEYMRANNGFTLIEVIVGITIMAIVLTSITSLIAQQIIQSAGQVNQLKANDNQKEDAIEYFKTTPVTFSSVTEFLKNS